MIQDAEFTEVTRALLTFLEDKMDELIDQFKKLEIKEEVTGMIYHKDCEKHFSSTKQAKLDKYLHVENPHRISKCLKFIKSVVLDKLQEKVCTNLQRASGTFEEQKEVEEELRAN